MRSKLLEGERKAIKMEKSMKRMYKKLVNDEDRNELGTYLEGLTDMYKYFLSIND